MIEPKKYEATVKDAEYKVTGYYVKHVWATPPPIATKKDYKDFVDTHTRHYIVTDGFSDWVLPREMQLHEIDVETLVEV